MKRVFWSTLLFPLLVISSAARPEVAAGETVLLLHGMGRTSFSMRRLAAELERDGCRVVNVSYPSRTKSIEELATRWLPEKVAQASGSAGFQPAASGQPPRRPALHIVTHSMGGILVRLWLRECGAPPHLGRVVMLAPPNAGSEVADRFEHFAPFRWVTGVNGARLTTAPDALPRALGPWPAPLADLGVIAGSRSVNPWMASWLPAPNDGKVTVASTHLAGERDHVVLPYSHTWLAWRRETIAQVKAFLRAGKFVD